MSLSSKFNKRILLAPLDWGLGHATRCIPIIRYLGELGCRVLIAAEGSQAGLLQQEFPDLVILPLKGYRIGYSGNKDYFRWKIAAQVPKILRVIKEEQRWLKEIAAKYKIDAVISDNRYGLYHPVIPSVFITHQLAIKSGISQPIDNWLRRSNYKYIHRFTECWIPDVENEKNLAGELSHPVLLPQNAKFIGWLSRMHTTAAEKEYDITCILSGPEPQRSLFEEKLLKQLGTFNGKSVLVRGLPGKASFSHPQIINHLPAAELNTFIQKSRLVICRSGYSSIMDLVNLKQKAILIPTPGQTEQEYLAGYLLKQKIFLSFSQDEFELNRAIKEADEFPFQFPSFKEDYQTAIEAFLKKL